MKMFILMFALIYCIVQIIAKKHTKNKECLYTEDATDTKMDSTKVLNVVA